ncbi:MAG: hypothetical protein C5B45_04570 [Chlamydiae bacterium]|nr:MAG: hypothetical protein C5B45_04570 [Chlamydiota bacterium]
MNLISFLTILIPCLFFINQEILSAAPFELKNFSLPLEVSSAFHEVHSNKLIPLKGISHRRDFIEKVKQGKWDLQPVIISQSAFVSRAMTKHLMTNKKDSALGVKHIKRDKITNMEGALHTFVTSICPVTMLGDYIYENSIETEGPSSLDGVIGSYSDAACHLQSNRENESIFIF